MWKSFSPVVPFSSSRSVTHVLELFVTNIQVVLVLLTLIRRYGCACTEMYGDVRRCTEMYGDVRRLMKMYGDDPPSAARPGSKYTLVVITVQLFVLFYVSVHKYYSIVAQKLFFCQALTSLHIRAVWSKIYIVHYTVKHDFIDLSAV